MSLSMSDAELRESTMRVREISRDALSRCTSPGQVITCTSATNLADEADKYLERGERPTAILFAMAAWKSLGPNPRAELEQPVGASNKS